MGHQNHIKNISEVKDVQPRPFDYLCPRGVAAKVRSVHLMFSKDWKLGRKGGTRPHPQQHHTSRTPILNEVLTGQRKSSGSSQTIPQKPHSFHKAKMHTTPSQLFHHTAHTSAHLISCVGGATTPPHNHTHFTPLLPFPWPHGPHNHTGVVYLINCHGLTFDLLPRPPRHLTGVKGQQGQGTRPPVTRYLHGPHK